MKTRWVLLVVIGLLLWVGLSRLIGFQPLRATVMHGQWPWLVTALGLQVLSAAAALGSYQLAFYPAAPRPSLRQLVPLALGSVFVGVAGPAGGAGRGGLFAEDLAHHGQPAAQAERGVRWRRLADGGTLLLVVIPSLVALGLQPAGSRVENAAALSLLLLAGAGSGVWLLSLLSTAGRVGPAPAEAAPAGQSARLGWIAAGAAGTHLLHLATLYSLLQAFHQPLGLGALGAAYAAGVSVQLLALTPQGLGLVEAALALTLTALGSAAAPAVAVTLAFRGLSSWLPLLLGFVAVQRLPSLSPLQRTRAALWSVRGAAGLVALMGLINVLAAVTPSLADRIKVLERFSPMQVRQGSHLTAALAGFALLVLAGHLNRRKRVAWGLTLGVLGLSAGSHLLKGLDYEEALLAGGLMLMLWLMRAQFHAHSDPPSMRQGLGALAAALLFTVAYGVLGFYLLDRHYRVSFGFWAALRQTLVMFTEFYDPGLTPLTRFGRYFADSIYVVGAVTLTYAGYMLLRPVLLRHLATDAERAHAQRLVEQYGHSSLARFLLFDDKRYFFTPGGSVIGYTLVGRSAVTLGDPIGPPEDQLAAVSAFQALCQRNDWLPIFYLTLPETLPIYRQAGLAALCVGHEAVVPLASFTLEGKAGKALRTPVNKLTKAGYRFVVHEPPLADTLLGELQTISDEWLAQMHGSEKKFALGWFDPNYVRHSRIGAVYTPDGWISAFANLVPEYQLNEVTLDLMRHGPAMENGTMDFLFASLFQWAQQQGYQGFNLGLSALAGVGGQASDPAVERVMHFIYEHVNQFYNFKGLHAFKEKFHPDWSPRYLIYPSSVNLVEAWVAVITAISGSPRQLTQSLRPPARRRATA